MKVLSVRRPNRRSYVITTRTLFLGFVPITTYWIGRGDPYTGRVRWYRNDLKHPANKILSAWCDAELTSHIGGRTRKQGP